MSALMLLRGLSFSTRKICSSLSKEMKFPNQERFASLSRRGWLEAGQEGAEDMKNLPPFFSLPFPVSLTLERTPASNWTSPRRWALGRGEHGRHLSTILVRSATGASRPSVHSPRPGAKPQMACSLMFLLGMVPGPLGHAPCGCDLLAMSQWEGEPEGRVGVSFRGGGSISSTQSLHLCSQPHLTPGCGNPGPSPLLPGPTC